MKREKLLRKLMSGSKNIKFSELQATVKLFGFQLDRISGSHHIYIHPEVPELVNIQNVKGKSKPYQIKQFLAIVERHNLQMERKK